MSGWEEKREREEERGKKGERVAPKKVREGGIVGGIKKRLCAVRRRRRGKVKNFWFKFLF